MTDHLPLSELVAQTPSMGVPGAKDDRPKSEKLRSRAQVPLHQAVLAIGNVLGEDHELFTEGQEFRGRVNAEISRLAETERGKR